jgi:hypothetical protein
VTNRGLGRFAYHEAEIEKWRPITRRRGIELSEIRGQDATSAYVKGFGRRPIATAREGTGAVVRKRPGKEPAGS